MQSDSEVSLGGSEEDGGRVLRGTEVGALQYLRKTRGLGVGRKKSFQCRQRRPEAEEKDDDAAQPQKTQNNN